MTEAIIFDCFGVIVTESWFSFKDKYFGNDETLATEATDIMDQANAGLFGYDEFTKRVGELAKIPAAQVDAYLDNNVADERLLTYIAEKLKPHYKIGMLSNASANWLGHMLSPAQRALFDTIDLSYETGHAKPDTEAYTELARRLGVKVSRCIFTDDQERYCIAARETGMQAIHYKDFTSFKLELERLTINA